MDFAVFFPHLVKAVVLLAPSGLIRPSHFGWQSQLLYSGILPIGLVRWMVRRRLQAPAEDLSKNSSDVESTVAEELKGARNASFEKAPLSKERPEVTVASTVSWQLENHQGFVASFVSSIRYASITGKKEMWTLLGERSDKILVMAGNTDPVIVPAELEEDAAEAMGRDKLEWRVIDGGHEFPITRSGEVVEEISRFWGL